MNLAYAGLNTINTRAADYYETENYQQLDERHILQWIYKWQCQKLDLDCNMSLELNK